MIQTHYLLQCHEMTSAVNWCCINKLNFKKGKPFSPSFFHSRSKQWRIARSLIQQRTRLTPDLCSEVRTVSRDERSGVIMRMHLLRNATPTSNTTASVQVTGHQNKHLDILQTVNINTWIFPAHQRSQKGFCDAATSVTSFTCHQNT